MRKIWLAVIVIAMGATAWAGELPTAEEVLAKMKAKWAGMKSYEMDMKLTEDTGDPTRGTTIAMHMVGERWEKEGKMVERSLVVGKIEMKKPEGKKDILSSTLAGTYDFKEVNDGTYVWREERNSAREGISVTKQDFEKARGQGPSMFEAGPKMLEEMVKDFDMKVAGEMEERGQKMYVLEGGWDAAKHGGMISKKKFWIGEDDLIIRRAVENNDDGKGKRLVETTEVTNVKVDQKIDPEVFKYVPPEGAVVEDRTKQ